MNRKPYRNAKRVFWIVDNDSIHRGQPAIDRFRAQWPNTVLLHTPNHASWLNQVEIYFSVVQRKVLTPNDFLSLDEVPQRLADFERYYQKVAVLSMEVHAQGPRGAPRQACQISSPAGPSRLNIAEYVTELLR